MSIPSRLGQVQSRFSAVDSHSLRTSSASCVREAGLEARFSGTPAPGMSASFGYRRYIEGLGRRCDSLATHTFIDAIGIMYGHQGHRSFVRARLLSSGLYVAFLAVAVVLIPLVLAGPGFADRLLPRPITWLGTLY